MTNCKQYLGDSVYAEFINGMILLTTENGGPPSNQIFLEPEVIQAFTEYLDWLRKVLREPSNNVAPEEA